MQYSNILSLPQGKWKWPRNYIAAHSTTIPEFLPVKYDTPSTTIVALSLSFEYGRESYQYEDIIRAISDG